ncbi:GreA/GreB family elongation factor [Lachnoclostridium sp. Marseille-P6806]|uniref:GreA/GreB family elongation factor n=1 Tax=Lachnoclostridium sp. Marseille-P6806 TaxID=2364793 RepID=UPI001030E8F5|nr:transcription elongation factor GreA [Lachnoclostridium sp. Marseille-P6806]
MRNKLTRNDIEEMQKEIDHRRLVIRQQALEEVKETRAQGDLSENFEYHAAKRFKNKNESRIRFLERMIRTAEIVEESSSGDEAGINKRVTIYIPEDDTEESYCLVSTIRGDSLKNLISIESPLGRALLGRKAGDTVTVRVSDAYRYTAVIRRIEDAGDDAEKAALRSF